MKTIEKKYPYLVDDRLSDVIRLIAVLAKSEKYSFRKNEGITNDLNSNPKSTIDWFNIAEAHPEFFRFNSNRTTIVLLLRYVSKPSSNEEIYPALDIDQTQKLIDQAIMLHDRQLSRYQRNNFKVPITVAAIAGLVTIITTIITISINRSHQNVTDSKIEHLSLKFDSLNSRNKIPSYSSNTPIKNIKSILIK